MNKEEKNFFLSARDLILSGDKYFIDEAPSFSDRDLCAVNEHGDTLLNVAVRKNRWESVRILYERGVDPLLCNNHGHNAVWLCRNKNKKFVPDFMLILLEELPVMTEEEPISKQEMSVKESTRIPVKKEIVEPNAIEVVVDQVIENLNVAIRTGNESLQSSLMRMAENLNTMDSTGHAPLGVAILLENWDCVDVLIHFGASLRFSDRQGLLKNQLSTHSDIPDFIRLIQTDSDIACANKAQTSVEYAPKINTKSEQKKKGGYKKSEVDFNRKTTSSVRHQHDYQSFAQQNDLGSLFKDPEPKKVVSSKPVIVIKRRRLV